jgi:hypothetical protein
LTNPARAGHLHPVTCRWFEAAASGTAILGRRPGNDAFNVYLGENMVTDLNPVLDSKSLYHKLEEIWHDRENKLKAAMLASEKKSDSWSWSERVERIMSLL